MATATEVRGRAQRQADQYCREFEQALPRIRLHAEVYFRHVRCPHKRDDFIQEAIALSWKWWLRLRTVGKDPTTFVSAIATYAARAARCGRRVCGHEKARDALSPVAQSRHGFTVSSIPLFSTLGTNPFTEALTDNTRTPVDEQVAFRVDFRAWLLTQTERSRRIIADLMNGERTQDVSRKHGTTPGRVSQLRREFHRDWHIFIGDLP